MPSRVMTPAEAVRLLNLAHECHVGGRLPPQEIIDKRREIEEATRHAELFMAMFRVVDENMVHRVVGLRVELDALYAAWAGMPARATMH